MSIIGPLVVDRPAFHADTAHMCFRTTRHELEMTWKQNQFSFGSEQFFCVILYSWIAVHHWLRGKEKVRKWISPIYYSTWCHCQIWPFSCTVWLKMANIIRCFCVPIANWWATRASYKNSIISHVVITKFQSNLSLTSRSSDTISRAHCKSISFMTEIPITFIRWISLFSTVLKRLETLYSCSQCRIVDKEWNYWISISWQIPEWFSIKRHRPSRIMLPTNRFKLFYSIGFFLAKRIISPSYSYRPHRIVYTMFMRRYFDLQAKRF